MSKDDVDVVLGVAGVTLTVMGMVGAFSLFIYRTIVRASAKAEAAEKKALDDRISIGEQTLAQHHDRLAKLEENMATRADVDELEQRQREDTLRIEHQIDLNKREVLTAMQALEQRLFSLVETLWKKAAGNGP